MRERAFSSFWAGYPVPLVLRSRTAIAIVVFLISFLPALTAEKYALVIGASNVSSVPDGFKAKYLSEDANSFKEFLRSPAGGGLPQQNLTLLNHGKADRDALFHALRELAKTVSHKDSFYLYFAGHGRLTSQGRVYFLLDGADWDLPQAGGIEASVLIQEIREAIRAKHIVFFVDACYAGAAANDGFARGNSEARLAEIWSKEWSKHPAVTMGFFSSQSNQPSWEDPELESGVFTHFALTGLNGAADKDESGTVTAGELQVFLRQSVPRYVMENLGNVQTPWTTPEFEPALMLSLYSPGKKGLLQQFDIQLRAGDFQKARQTLEAAAKRYQESAPIYEAHARLILAFGGDERRATWTARRAVVLDGRDARARYTLARALCRAGSFGDAYREIETARRLDDSIGGEALVSCLRLLSSDRSESSRVMESDLQRWARRGKEIVKAVGCNPEDQPCVEEICMGLGDELDESVVVRVFARRTGDLPWEVSECRANEYCRGVRFAESYTFDEASRRICWSYRSQTRLPGAFEARMLLLYFPREDEFPEAVTGHHRANSLRSRIESTLW